MPCRSQKSASHDCLQLFSRAAVRKETHRQKPKSRCSTRRSWLSGSISATNCTTFCCTSKEGSSRAPRTLAQKASNRHQVFHSELHCMGSSEGLPSGNDRVPI